MAIAFENLNIDKLSDQDKENEYLVSEHLNGSLYPSNYITLINELAKLPIISITDDAEYYKLINKIRDTFISDVTGLLDRDQVIKLYNGDAKLINLFQDLQDILIGQSSVLLQIDANYAQKIIANQLATFEAAADDTELVGKLISTGNQPIDPNKEILDNVTDCIIACNNIISVASDIKDDFEELNYKPAKKIEDLQLQLLDLSSALMESNLPFEYAYKLTQVINMIQTNIPQTDLDPFKNDVFEMLLTLLRQPKKFYSYLKKNEIIDGEISSQLFQVYPKIFEQSVIPLLEQSEKKDYQKQLIFKNQCDLIDDNRELVTFCHNHLLGDNNNGN
ncbi:MAG: hypothetical protein ACK40T_02600 [Akkermansiaceae bacterium]|jgi:hypothetical protein